MIFYLSKKKLLLFLSLAFRELSGLLEVLFPACPRFFPQFQKKKKKNFNNFQNFHFLPVKHAGLILRRTLDVRFVFQQFLHSQEDLFN